MRHETHCKLASYIYQKKCSSFADGPAWCVGKDMDRRKTRHSKLSGQNIVRDFCIAASYMAMAGWTSCEMTRRSWKWDRLPYFSPLSVFKQAAASRMTLDYLPKKLVVGKTIMFLISLLLRSVVRRQFVMAYNLYSCIHSFAVLPDLFTDNGQITLRKHKTGKRNTNRMMFLFCFL